MPPTCAPHPDQNDGVLRLGDFCIGKSYNSTFESDKSIDPDPVDKGPGSRILRGVADLRVEQHRAVVAVRPDQRAGVCPRPSSQAGLDEGGPVISPCHLLPFLRDPVSMLTRARWGVMTAPPALV